MQSATEHIKVEMEEDGTKNVKDSDIHISKVMKKMAIVKGKAVKGAKREDTFTDHLKAMKKKHKEIYDICDYGKSVFSICGFDGSEHQNGVLRKINMLTFNTQLFNKLLQDMGVTTANSSNILTIFQVRLKTFLIIFFFSNLFT